MVGGHRRVHPGAAVPVPLGAGAERAAADGNLVRYNSYEMASRLSYLLWATMPDDKLFAAADADALQTPEQIAAEATRLLADERAKQGLADFHLQWLEIGPLTQIAKDEEQKNWSPAVAQSMLNETRDFVASVYRGEKASGTLEALLTSRTDGRRRRPGQDLRASRDRRPSKPSR